MDVFELGTSSLPLLAVGVFGLGTSLVHTSLPLLAVGVFGLGASLVHTFFPSRCWCVWTELGVFLFSAAGMPCERFTAEHCVHRK